MWANLQNQVRSLRANQQLTVEGQLLAKGLPRGLDFIGKFKDTPEAAGIVARRAQAIRLELARRLGLDPSSQANLDLAGRLASVLVEAQKDVKPKKSAPSALHQQAVQAAPELANLPWDRIESVLTQNPPLDEEVLALLLPVPEATPLEAELKPICEANPSPATVATDTIPKSFWPKLWFFSPRDLAWKFAAAAGLALLLGGGIGDWQRRAHDREQARLYDTLLSSAREHDSASVLALATRFVQAAETPRSDPRLTQVLQLADQAAYQEFFRLSDQGQTPQAAAVLEQHERLVSNVSVP